MKILKGLFLVLFIFESESLAANWYVDNTAPAGGNGTSWATAWRNFSDIPTTTQGLWVPIQPGDTIYISGGRPTDPQGGKVYTSGLTIRKSGSVGNPIWIKTGRHAPASAGHDGRVIYHTAGISFNGHDYVEVNGLKDLAQPYPSARDLADVLTESRPLADNINWEVRNPVLLTAFGVGVFISGGTMGSKLIGIEIHHIGEPYEGDKLSNETGTLPDSVVTTKPYSHGIQLKDMDEARGVEIAYCHIHHNGGDGINSPSGLHAAEYGYWSIHHNLIEENRDDGIQTPGSVDIYNNIIRGGWTPSRGHPDGIQIPGPYVRIYNNIMYDLKNSYMRMESGTQYGAGHRRVFNNVFFAKEQLTSVSGSKINEGPIVFISHSITSTNYRTFSRCGMTKTARYYDFVSVEDMVLANNVFGNFRDGSVFWMGGRVFDETSCSDISDYYIGELRAKNVYVVNNIVVDAATERGGHVMALSFKPEAGGEIIFDNNVISGPNGLVTFLGKPYETPEALNADPAYHFTKNTSLTPLFMDSYRFDYHLMPTDPAATARGADFRRIEAALSTDHDGKTRTLPWDAGPFKNQGCLNQNPIAYFEPSITMDYAPKTVSFNAERSMACAGGSLSYDWDFGDGTHGSGVLATHEFTAAGSYVVKLTLTNVADGVTRRSTYERTLRLFPQAEPGLLLYLKFDKELTDWSGRVDFTGKPLHEVLATDPQFEPSLPGFGEAIRTDATHSVGVPHKSDLVGMPHLTLACWAKKNQATSETRGLVTKFSSAYSMRISQDSYRGIVTASPGFDQTVKPAAIANTDWHHYALVYDGSNSTVVMYVDGEPVKTGPASGPVSPTNDRTLSIGAYPGAENFHGLIDEVKIYDIAKSADDIKKMFLEADPRIPRVSLGDDLFLILPAQIELNPVAQDSDTPLESLGFTWQRLSGPTSLTIEPTNTKNTSLSFVEEGMYELELAVSDGEHQSSDRIKIRVYPAGTVNQAPQITKAFYDAATDSLVVELTDEGLPNASLLDPVWTRIAGPGVVNFASSRLTRTGDNATVRTGVTFLEVGDYTLEFKIGDGALVGTARLDVSITWNDLPPGEGPSQAATLGGFLTFKNLLKLGQDSGLNISFRGNIGDSYELRLLNRRGQKVREFPSGSLNQTDQAVFFDGKNDQGEFVAAGIYTLHLKIRGETFIRKIVVVK